MTLHNSLIVSIVLLSVSPGNAQKFPSPYQFEWGTGLAVGGIGFTTFGLGHYFDSRNSPLTEEELLLLKPEDVLYFDRLATHKSNRTALIISDVTGYGATILPLSLMASERIRDNSDDAGLLYAQAILLNTGVTTLVKNTIRRPRPYVYNPDIPLSRKQVKDARRSFFSGHTSNAAVHSFFTAKVYDDFYPTRRGDGWVWVSAAILPAITGTTRVLSGNHYWSDVALGYLVGAGIGVLVPQLYKL